jgi:vacuolar-type H+-ATPase subunit E/Vma4
MEKKSRSNAASRKDELIIAALIGNPTVRAAATACGVSESQVYARLRKPAFKAKYDEARRELLQQSTAYIQGIVSEAVQKMRDVMNDPDVSAQVQLNAAEAITRNSLKLTEQNDILTQIAELKKAVFTNE